MQIDEDTYEAMVEVYAREVGVFKLDEGILPGGLDEWGRIKDAMREVVKMLNRRGVEPSGNDTGDCNNGGDPIYSRSAGPRLVKS